MYRYLALLLLAMFGCASPTTPKGLPEGPPTLTGPIIARDLQFGAVRDRPNLHVRPATDECGIVFVVDERTAIGVRTADGCLQRGTLDDLAVGRTVRAWARGVILESCPGQAAAAAIELLE